MMAGQRARIGSEFPYEEDVYHFEDRLHQHLQYHGDGQHQNGAEQSAARIVLRYSFQGVGDGRKQTYVLPLRGHCLVEKMRVWAA
jgi:hypothetical protein